MNCKQIKEAIGAATRPNMYAGHVASHLNGCSDCRRYSDETASLLGLLGAQPRVEAPPDFEFRLRARIAVARETAPRSFLRRILPETFSWGRMAVAGAAGALAIAVSTFYIDLHNRTPDSPVRAIDQRPNEPAPESRSISPAESARPALVRSTNRSARLRRASFRSETSPDAVTGVEVSTRLYSPEMKRLLNDRGGFYGAETASINLAKPINIALTF